MKLYHGTSAEAAKSIIENGFVHCDAVNKKQGAGERAIPDDIAAVYGFDNYGDAEDFAINQGYDNLAVVSFEVDEAEEDPEYDSGAFYTQRDPQNVKIEWLQEL